MEHVIENTKLAFVKTVFVTKKHVSLAAFLLLSISVSAQLNADFSVSSSNGCVPFSVQLNNLTPHQEGNSYNWDFGNGQTSTLQNPVVLYSNTGSYTITLSVKNGQEEQEESKPDYITVHPSFEVDLSPSEAYVDCAPYSISFQSSISENQDHLTYSWDFGDGIASEEANPIHTYNEEGIFTVSLLVVNQYGCVGSTSREQLATVYKPVPIFEVSESESCEGELLVEFENLSYGLGELSYFWDFGDGKTSQEKSPTHLYTQPGSYNVQLKCINEIGCEQLTTVENCIVIEDTHSLFETQSDTVCLNEIIKFKNHSINARKYHWDFGDGSNSSVAEPTHKYNDYGTFKVTLTIENYECSDVYEKIITVEEVKADFITDKNFLCSVPGTVTYIDKSVNAAEYYWGFGNGTSSNSNAPQVEYSLTTLLGDKSREHYSDTLRVVSSHGCESKIVKTDNILIAFPRVKVVSDETSGCVPLDCSFSVATEYNVDNDQIVSYTWQLDDNEVSETNQWQNNFDEIGVYNVGIELTTELGCVAKDEVLVKVGTPQKPDFTVEDKNVFCANELVSFRDLSTDQSLISQRDWEFGDGQSSFLGESFHLYVDTGYMDVTLMVTYNGCTSSITKKDIVYINGPIADFNRVNACNNKNIAQLEASLLDATSYEWDFGDGQIQEGETLLCEHAYSAPGYYIVSLTASNETNGCTNVSKKGIHITNLKANVSVNLTNACANQKILFDPTLSVDATGNPAYKGKYFWNFGDGSPGFYTNKDTVHQYKTGGQYTAILYVRDVNECIDTATVNISVYQPKPNFLSNYKEGCIPFTFSFLGQSESELPITEWLWDFGDNKQEAGQNIEHDYTEFGNYNVSLQVTDELGCIGKKMINNAIEVSAPDASFTVSDKTSCINETLVFKEASSSNIESFFWDFGDDNTSTDMKPEHSYSNPGLYDISLKITDDHGCIRQQTVEEYISIQKPPSPDFLSDMTQSNCYPFPVKFKDKSVSENLYSWKWKFGDNLGESSIQNPSHIYTKPGLYDVTLFASTSNGCVDSITKHEFVDIGGPYADIVSKDTFCIYDHVIINMENEQNISSYTWYLGDGTIANESPVSHKYNRKGKTEVHLVLQTNSSFACEKVFKKEIYIDEVEASFDFTDLLGAGCVPYTVSTQNTSNYSSSWEWFFNDHDSSKDKNASYTFNSDGIAKASLVAQSDFGCKDTLVRKVTVHPLPIVSIINNDYICKDSNIELWAEGGVEYNWTPNINLDDSSIPNPIATPGNNTQYTVVVTDENGCVKKDSVFIKVQQYPKVVVADTSIIIGESIAYNYKDNEIESYSWFPDAAISCTDCSNPIINPLESREYVVSVTDTAECFTIDYPFNVNVIKKYSVDVPTAFTPNNDGINDIIMVNGWGIKEVVYFRIYNRQGQLLFESNKLNAGWNGKYKGTEQNIDIYNYEVKVVTFVDSELYKRGQIQLIR